MKRTNLIFWFVLFFGIAFFLKDCTNKKNEKQDIRIDTIFITKTKKDFKPTSQDKPEKSFIEKIIYKNTIIHDTIIITVFDTIKITKIVKEFYTKNFFKDTILNTSSGLIVINDTIFKNSIISRKSDIKLHEKTILNQNNNMFFVGGGLLNEKTNVAPFVNLQFNHKKHLFGVGYSTKKQLIFTYNYKLF